MIQTPKFKIEQYQQKHFTFVEALINEEFGEKYLNAKDNFTKYTCVLVATVDDKVIGFSAGTITTRNDPNYSKIQKYTNVDNAGILDLIVTDSAFRKQGIANALFQKRLNILSSAGTNTLLIFHWVTKDNPEPTIACRFGFEKTESISGYWTEESLKLEYNCAVCGPPSCMCTCAVYKLTIKPGTEH